MSFGTMGGGGSVVLRKVPRGQIAVGAATFPIYRGEVPWLTTEQMLEVDRAMIEDYGIKLIQ